MLFCQTDFDRIRVALRFCSSVYARFFSCFAGFFIGCSHRLFWEAWSFGSFS